jgi:GT2 family glycosyltransferase
VIPTKDRWGALSRLLECLDRQQADAAFEIVVIDDGSNAPPPASPVMRGRPVRVIRTPNGGRAAARNRGASDATGEILIFLDDDMHVAADFVARHIDAHSRSGRVILGPTPLPGDIEDTAFGRFRAWLDLRQAVAAVDDLSEVDGLSGANMSIARSAFERTGGFDERLTNPGCEDYAFHLRARRAGLITLYARAIPAWHDDEFRDLISYGRRQRVYAAGWVQLMALEPAVLEEAPRFRTFCFDNDVRLARYLALRRRSAVVAKAILHRARTVEFLYRIVPVLERMRAPDVLLRTVYLRILSLETFRGYSEGVRRYLRGQTPDAPRPSGGKRPATMGAGSG